ncbi:hypothetical protein [Treponema sp. R80B11-R83G3]
MAGYENNVKTWTKSNYLYESADLIFMYGERKTAVNLFFTENCTKQQYRSEMA